MGINIRKKGSEGELELCKRLQPFFSNILKRNLNQTREGGADIEGCHPFQIEVKRVQDISLGNKNSWWRQVTKACNSPEEIPIVAFRPNKAKWRYLVPSSLIIKDCPEHMEVSEEVFLKLVINILSPGPSE